MGFSNESRILCVGLACVDIICVTATYPEEDSDQRALEQRWHRGGNASNMCTVLSHLKTPCEFLGTLASDENSRFLTKSFEANNIPTRYCELHEGCVTPSSIILINKENGSRTIVAGIRNLPELSSAALGRMNLQSTLYKWIHFEGRPNTKNLTKMLQIVEDFNSQVEDPRRRVITSIEFEKHRDGIDELHDMADYVFISKDYARLKGFSTKEDAVKGFSDRCKPGSTVICAWGTLGAAAFVKESQTLVTSASFPPKCVVDTLGAGDTFVAATIHCLSQNMDIQDAIIFGCKVAGAKVGMKGFSGLEDLL